MRTPELLSDPVYHDEDAARAYLEANRWPEFVSCPLCGSVEKISQLGGESMGPGWWYCGACQDKFTVLGGEGKTIEADETYFGRVGDPKATVFVNDKGWVRRDGEGKMKIATLVERGGKARSVQIDRATTRELGAVLARHADPQSRLMTD